MTAQRQAYWEDLLDRPAMALLRAASEQLLGSRAAPWIQRGLGTLKRTFAAQAEPLEEDEGTYVVTDGIQ